MKRRTLLFGTASIIISHADASTLITRGAESARGFGFGYKKSGGSGPTPGSHLYTTSGTYCWIAPACVRSVSVVAVGGGACGTSGSCCYGNVGGKGGGLGYKNNYSTTPGNSYRVYVGPTGQNAYFVNACTLIAYGGINGGSFSGCGGGNGGTYGTNSAQPGGSGGGGAGGYSGNGGAGASCGSGNSAAACSGAAAGGAGHVNSLTPGDGGGGVKLCGKGSTGSGGSGGGSGGSGGCAGATHCGNTPGKGGKYGGGGGGGKVGFTGICGTIGAVRIVWPGSTRKFPSCCVGAP